MVHPNKRCGGRNKIVVDVIGLRFTTKRKRLCSLVIVLPIVLAIVWCLYKYPTAEWSWCDGAEAVAMSLGLIGGIFAYYRWQKEITVQKVEFLQSLISRFESNEIQRILDAFDSQEESDDWFLMIQKDAEGKLRRATESFFRFLSYICYLEKRGLIGDDEFSVFDAYLARIMNDDNVKKYLMGLRNRICPDMSQSCDPFRHLTEYAKSKKIAMENVSREQILVDSNDQIRNPVSSNEGDPLTDKDFTCPTIVVRINRLWHDNMSESGLYDVTRGWWRVNVEVAKNIKLALAVAKGKVVAAYRVNGWNGIEGDKCRQDGRMQFIKDDTSDGSERVFLGKSVEGLFRQGDAYPIRYFGMNRVKNTK